MLGKKTKTGKEKGDIVKAVGVVSLQELAGESLQDYDTVYPTELVGFFTGNVRKIAGSNYDEIVLTIALNDDKSPDFSQEKYYYLEGMAVSFVANPDYDYSPQSNTKTDSPSPKKKSSFDWLGTIGTVLNTIGTVLGLSKKTDQTKKDTGSDTTTSVNNEEGDGQTEKTWLQRNLIYVLALAGILITGGLIVYFSKRSERKSHPLPSVPPPIQK
ncbi:hypothetical protein [Emticicia sp. 17c]|uniref:hypothetical protein n=1 Tax=Emticicia sp. 17c TaxID=3127704 RepID=UPI00301D63FE